MEPNKAKTFTLVNVDKGALIRVLVEKAHKEREKKESLSRAIRSYWEYVDKLQ